MLKNLFPFDMLQKKKNFGLTEGQKQLAVYQAWLYFFLKKSDLQFFVKNKSGFKSWHGV